MFILHHAESFVIGAVSLDENQIPARWHNIAADEDWPFYTILVKSREF